ncbi:MAG TPA: hypothetical protein PLX97_13585, partial [Gemmatales bacterium]|nr:hypothetical protein [Gemmatales bacterium]
MSGVPNQPQKPGVPPAGAQRPAAPVTGKPATPPAAAKPGIPARPATPPAAGAKPAVPGAAKPGLPPPKPGVAPGKPGLPPPKPGQPAGKAPLPPPKTAAAAGKAPAKPAAPAARKQIASSGGRKKLGQILIDLGLLEEDQLWEVLNEAREGGQLVGQAALARGLVTEEQLFQALAEQYGMKLVNLNEVKFQSEAIEKVPETMAPVYKVVPIALKDNVLTVALVDPNQLPAPAALRT